MYLKSSHDVNKTVIYVHTLITNTLFVLFWVFILSTKTIRLCYPVQVMCCACEKTEKKVSILGLLHYIHNIDILKIDITILKQMQTIHTFEQTTHCNFLLLTS